MMMSDLGSMSMSMMMPTSSSVSRSVRDVSPAHYLFKIQSYSILKETVDKCESNIFEAGGHKWRLVLYPNGNKKSNGSGYVSLYLKIEDTEKLSHHWKVNVNFKLFVFNQKNNNYLTIQDADGAVRKYHEMKTEWGFDQLIWLDSFLKSSNGYVVRDSCVFGAEVFVISHSGKSETLTMVKDPPHGYVSWKLGHFSKLDQTEHKIKSFTVGERDWRLSLYPKGNSKERGKHLSVYLELVTSNKFPPRRTVYAKFKLRILDQLHNKHYDKQLSNWFSNVNLQSWGYPKFITLSDLHEKEKGYLKDDTLILEVQILALSTAKFS